ncbi:hypothetical protein BGX27_002376 [Mortierella sp. AM989]|nr:hypothetical protein BGX27_002376 [Mortierella sp. AM989]
MNALTGKAPSVIMDSNATDRKTGNSYNNTANAQDTPGTQNLASTGDPAIHTPLQWYTVRSTTKKQLNFPDFVVTLGYWQQKDADDAYRTLLSFSEVRERVRKAMSNQYETWQNNDGKEFWATRAIKSSLSMTAKRAAVGIISKSEVIINSNLAEDGATDSGNATNPSVPPFAEAGSEVGTDVEIVEDLFPPCSAMGWMLQLMDNLVDAYDYDASYGDEQNDQEKADQSPTKKRKGSKKFDDDRRKSLQRRYSELGDKWTLKSGTVVENVLLNAGMKLKEFHPIHSFMLDLSDKYTRELFSQPDWTEICSNLPGVPSYSEKASNYMDQFENVATLCELEQLLDKRPQDIESRLIHGCLSDWYAPR